MYIWGVSYQKKEKKKKKSLDYPHSQASSLAVLGIGLGTDFMISEYESTQFCLKNE